MLVFPVPLSPITITLLILLYFCKHHSSLQNLYPLIDTFYLINPYAFILSKFFAYLYFGFKLKFDN